MRAADLELDELVHIEDGMINFHGRRLVLHSIHAFGRFRKDIVDMLGVDHARRLFTRFGYFWGQADAAAMQRLFEWDSLEEWIRAGARLHTLGGIVKASIQEMQVDRDNGRLSLIAAWHESGEAIEHLMEIGPSQDPICWKLVGYASGYASYCMGKSIYFIERMCHGKGDRFCQAVGKDIDSWGAEIEPHMPYFEAEDIKGAVAELSRELLHKEQELARQRRQLEKLRHKPVSFFVEGRSKQVQQVLDLAGRVAPFDTSVLITGETGVGKEVLARYIHGESHRSEGPFLAVNCGALPETLLESELFGHRKGSFTGAVGDRTGMFEEAAGGTIFLDEIGDISPATQMKILRVLQEHEVTRVGENQPRKIDVRVIAATNRDLDKAVAENQFREDLLYRLRVLEIEMPPLRERRSDILPLARFLIQRIAKKLGLASLHLDATCADLLHAYRWPGNVRELENALERAAVLSRDGVIRQEHLPHKVQQVRTSDFTLGGGRSLKEVEQTYIRKILEAEGGNRTRTANVLGISPVTLWRKLKADQR